ncbi:unnamed protein product [Lampetra fluviatilis]
MADVGKVSSGIFAKNAKKRITRAQEKVLQKLGKADETKDTQFEQLVHNFSKQYGEGTRLHKEVKAYLAAVKAMHESSKKLIESLQEIYEPDWYGKELIQDIAERNNELWEDFHQKLVDLALLTLDIYLGQFPDIKTRIAKRGRKLVDYDSTRHHLEALTCTRKKDDSKISKAEEDFLKAQKVFEELNVDLQEELPILWNSRIGFYVNTFRSIASLEEKFHREIGLLNHELYEVMVKLGDQHADLAFSIRGAPSDSGPLKITETPCSPPEITVQAPTSLFTGDEQALGPNHMSAPLKSPSLGRKGPPVPPPPKLTPSKEVQQEAIFSLFDDNFVPDFSSAPAEAAKKDEGSLLDIDFDPLKPDTATTPMSPAINQVGFKCFINNYMFTDDLFNEQPGSAGESEEKACWSWDKQEELEVSLVQHEQCNSESEPFKVVLGSYDGSVSAEFSLKSDCADVDVGERSVASAQLDEQSGEAMQFESQCVSSALDKSESCEQDGDNLDEPRHVKDEGVFADDHREHMHNADEVAAETLDIIQPNAENEEGVDQHRRQSSKQEAEPETAAGEEEYKDSHIAVSTPLHTDAGQNVDKEQLIGPRCQTAVGVASNPDPVDSGPELDMAFVTNGDAEVEASKHVDTSSESTDMPPGFLYKVQAEHDYTPLDADELTLLRGDVVLVLSFENADEQDAGWLTGIKEADWMAYKDLMGRKGVFPENFTQRLE